jgi:hypothetical protein
MASGTNPRDANHSRVEGTSGMKSLLAGLAAMLSAAAASPAESLRDGDLIFHTSRSSQSVALQRATHSPYSHVGVILHRGGKPFVFEAIAKVQYTPLQQWIDRGERKAYVVKRLKTPLTDTQALKLRIAAARYVGKPYDLYFEWSDDRIYCSELVWKMYRDELGIEIGALQRLHEFDLSDPAVKSKMRERYGAIVPMNEPVIAPAALFESMQLVTVPR